MYFKLSRTSLAKADKEEGALKIDLSSSKLMKF